jgi:hypothetical protein
MRELHRMELKDWEKLRVRENKISEYNVRVKIYRLSDSGNSNKETKIHTSFFLIRK